MAQLPPAAEPRQEGMTLRRAVTLFVAAAAVLVTAASVLPGVAEQLAAATGLGHSFVGTLFVAATTSLPEVVVSMTAMRMGALDMAAANLFGSNLFNVAVLGVDDLLYLKGPMLASVSPAHLLASTGAIIMTAFAVIGLTFRAAHKRFRLSWDSVGIVGIYVAAVWLLGSATG
jgi:cation:H+ antiporter